MEIERGRKKSASFRETYESCKGNRSYERRNDCKKEIALEKSERSVKTKNSVGKNSEKKKNSDAVKFYRKGQTCLKITLCKRKAIKDKVDNQDKVKFWNLMDEISIKILENN